MFIATLVGVYNTYQLLWQLTLLRHYNMNWRIDECYLLSNRVKYPKSVPCLNCCRERWSLSAALKLPGALKYKCCINSVPLKVLKSIPGADFGPLPPHKTNLYICYIIQAFQIIQPSTSSRAGTSFLVTTHLYNTYLK